MVAKRQKKNRYQWFAMDVDAFLEDDRVIRLSDRDQALWALLLIKMWRSKARIPDDALYLSRVLGISKNEAIKFKNRLQELQLLIFNDAELISPRLMDEYNLVEEVYISAIAAGKKSAARRAELYGTAQPLPNNPSNRRSNDLRTDIDLD